MLNACFHPLDKLRAYGSTLHGLFDQTGAADGRVRMGGTWFDLRAELAGDYSDRVVDAYAYDYASLRNQDAHLLRVPDVAPLPFTPEQLTSELAAGRSWQNYALVSGAHFGLFGTRLNGWVWIDEQGARWHVAGGTFNNLQHDPQTALTLNLSVRPFGELGAAPVAPQLVTCTLADIGQLWPGGVADAYVWVRFACMSSHGRQALYEIYEPDNFGYQNRFPVGWLRLTLSNVSEPTAVLEVLRTRTQAYGTQSATDVSMVNRHQFVLPCEVTDEGGDEYGRRLIVNAPQPADAYMRPAPTGTGTRFGVGETESVRTQAGRIVRINFDDADQLVEFTVTQQQRLICEFGAPTLTGWSAPSIAAWFATGPVPEGVAGQEWVAPYGDGTEYTVSVGFSQSYTVREVCTQTLTRNGIELETATVSSSIAFNTTGTLRHFDYPTGIPSGSASPPELLSTELILNAAKRISEPSTVTRTAYGGNCRLNGVLLSSSGSAGSAVFSVEYGNDIYAFPNYLLGYPRNPTVTVMLTREMVGLPWSTAAERTAPVVLHSVGLLGLSSHVLHSESAELSVSYSRRRHGTYAPQAEWVNPNPAQVYTTAIRATYHPLTHEIAQDLDGSLGSTFTFI